jgi:hypothetical protein
LLKATISDGVTAKTSRISRGSGVEEDAVTDREYPVEPVLPHRGQAGERVVVADPPGGALDHDVEAGAIRVGSGGQHAMGVCFDVLRLLLLGARPLMPRIACRF